MQKISIAIDGHSSTGKSTLARQLAKALGYVYVDSGAMYRAVTLHALNAGLLEGSPDVPGIVSQLKELELDFEMNPKTGRSEIRLNGTNVERQIRSLEVSQWVSEVSAIPEVRAKLVGLQQEMGRNRGVVMDGRDIGTVVLPGAELKVFMTASPEIRARRRYEELKARGSEVSFGEVLDNVRHRDHMDTHREISPLVQAEDAVCLDNSDLDREEQFNRVLALANRVLEEKKQAP